MPLGRLLKIAASHVFFIDELARAPLTICMGARAFRAGLSPEPRTNLRAREGKASLAHPCGLDLTASDTTIA